jgi:hypothetical protein
VSDADLSVFEPAVRDVLLRARKDSLNYGVRVLVAPDGVRHVAVLGEAHIKLGGASTLGQDVVRHFALRGVETFPRDRVPLGRTLGILIQGPRLLLRTLSLGLVKDSTIVDAKRMTGITVELEKGWEIPRSLQFGSVYLTVIFATLFATLLLEALVWVWPGAPVGMVRTWLASLAFILQVHMLALIPAVMARRHSWSWMLHPVVAILTDRDTLMAKGTVRMLDENPEIPSALVVMGRAHLPGFERELVTQHGFRRLET